MARYKDYSYEQTKLIPLSFHHQILAGTFEYTLNYLIDNEVDLSLFEQRYHNRGSLGSGFLILRFFLARLSLPTRRRKGTGHLLSLGG